MTHLHNASIFCSYQSRQYPLQQDEHWKWFRVAISFKQEIGRIFSSIVVYPPTIRHLRECLQPRTKKMCLNTSPIWVCILTISTFSYVRTSTLTMPDITMLLRRRNSLYNGHIMSWPAADIRVL